MKTTQLMLMIPIMVLLGLPIAAFAQENSNDWNLTVNAVNIPWGRSLSL
ncbi:MAG: hypothetical protein WAM14_13060 [Candidatus Nitrosopolaris sp.]